jgi:hypothetical protein
LGELKKIPIEWHLEKITTNSRSSGFIGYDPDAERLFDMSKEREVRVRVDH